MGSSKVVVALGSRPDVRAAANALAAKGARTVTTLSLEEAALRGFLRDLTVNQPNGRTAGKHNEPSVCFVAGAVASDTNPDGVRIADMAMLIRALRQVCAAGRLSRWGVVTAPTPADFERQIEMRTEGDGRPRTVGERPVLMLPRDGPPWGGRKPDDESVDDESLDRESGRAAHMPADDGHSRGVEVVPTSQFVHHERRIRAKRYGAIFVEGHGRSYCVNEGMLCGGGALVERGERQSKPCLARFDCASERHIRRPPSGYATDLFVVDACEAGGYSGPACRLGDWPIGVKLLAGADAVVASDIAVVRTNGQLETVLEIARDSETLGDFVAALNAYRRPENPPMPYHLLGDPEAPCPIARHAPRTGGAGAERRDPVRGDAETPSECQWVSDPVRTAFQSLHDAARNGLAASDLVATLGRTTRDLSDGIETLVWPNELWSSVNMTVELSASPCPQCGEPGASERTYDGLDGRRRLIECAFCRLANDHPADVDARILFDIDDALRRGHTGVEEETPNIRLTVTAGSEGVIGAISVSTGIAARGPRVMPDGRTVLLNPQESEVLDFRLEERGPEDVAQIYYLKATALLNGRLHLACAPLACAPLDCAPLDCARMSNARAPTFVGSG